MNGVYRGFNVWLLFIDIVKFVVKIRIENGVFDGRVIIVEYEDICKISL